MNNFDKLLNEVKSELANEECVKEYFYYKNIIDNNDELKSLDEEVRFHQKEMCKNKQNPEVYAKEKESYDALKEKLDSNPILINYQIAKDEVYSLLLDIKQVLS